MEKQKKSQIKKIISWVLIVCIVALLAFLPIIAANEEQASGPQASILKTKAELRNISTVVLGGGNLIADDMVAVTIPAEVKVKEYLVDNGDIVEEGQPVAKVDRVSVMAAITQVQDAMEQLQKSMNKISSDTDSGKVTATAGGTVKVIYGSVGEDVQDVMLRDGALAVLSLDDMMAVRVNRNTNLVGGDTVCVTLSDGTEVDGRVESNLEGVLTVTIDDEGFAIGEAVKVTTVDGDRIGSGELYVHSPWNVIAYTGTISRVRVTEGKTVSAGYRLFDLKIEGHTAQFDAMSSQHRKYEDMMLELFKMYQSETVLAPKAGQITGVDKDGVFMLSGTAGEWKLTFLANGPNNDENTYTNYVGQVTQVGSDGLVMKMNPWPFSVEDYKNLSGVNLSVEQMTQSTIYSGTAPIYELKPVTSTGTESQPAEGENATPPADSSTTMEWVQVYGVSAGDILLFAGANGTGVVWIVRVGHSSISDPTTPTNPTTPEGGQQGGGRPNAGGGGGMPSVGGSGMPGMGGGTAQQGTNESYTLDTVTIASVTPQERVTIQMTIDELDISKLYVGQAADVTVEALPGQQFSGVITEIAASGENEGGNSKFAVEVTLDKIDDMLPGMRASVSVVLATSESVICIPVAALIESGTKTQVYIGYDEDAGAFVNPVTVTTGVSDGEYVQILTGLQEGDEVHYPYYDTLVISNAPKSGSGFGFG